MAVQETTTVPTGSPVLIFTTDADDVSGVNVNLPGPSQPNMADVPAADTMSHDNPEKPIRRRRKRLRKASEAGGRSFSDWYISTGELLGEGAFGHVITHKHVRTNQEYAVKMIVKTKTRTRSKVFKECDILMRARNRPNIVHLFEFFEDDERFFMIFEKLEGDTLMRNIWKRESLTEFDVSRVVMDIANGLLFLHQKGIAHRDVKPDNILCAKAGQLVPVKLIDFDLANMVQLDKRNADCVTTPRLRSPVGSVDFMAPEVVGVWQDKGWSYDKRCDLWSLGVVLYLLLCGYIPFRGQGCGKDCGWNRGLKCEDCQNKLFTCIRQGNYTFPEQEWSKVSSEAKDLVDNLLVTNPCWRFSAADVLQHPWIKDDLLHSCPVVLFSNSSTDMKTPTCVESELNACVESVVEVNRLVSMHLFSEMEKNALQVPDIDHLDVVLSKTHIDKTAAAEEEQHLKIAQFDSNEKMPEEFCEPCGDEESSGFQCTEDILVGESDRVWGSDENLDSVQDKDQLCQCQDCSGGADEFVFHMSDVEDDGIGEWAGREDARETCTSEWCSAFSRQEVTTSRPSFDDDSGNGNSTRSVSPVSFDPPSVMYPTLPAV